MKHYEETTTYKCYEFSTECKRLTTAINRMCKAFSEISDDIKDLRNTYDYYGGDFNECDDTTTYGDKQNASYRHIVEFDGEHCYICMYYFEHEVETTETINTESNNTNNEESDTTETVNNDTNETAETDNNEESDTNDTKDTESDTTETVNNDTNETAETDNNEESDTNNEESDTNDTTDTTINNILESIGNKQLIKTYVDGINNGLQNDNYKQTRECFCKLVQILPNSYEICFTTKFNVDMTKVDVPIYNNRYKIIRDKTGLMFTIHKYSEIQHKYIPLKPETKITDIIRYIYFRTFDSVCRVFKHDSTLESITKLENLFDTVEKYKNSYLWYGDNGNISAREYKEKKESIDEFEWYDNGDKYTAEYTVKFSKHNTYAYGTYTKNGMETTLTAIKNSYNRLLQAVQRE